ncbi:MAG: hypothetical protein WA783_20955 [Phormidesmis sp.]
MQFLSTRELLGQQSQPTVENPIAVDADLSLKESAVEALQDLLRSHRDIDGLSVVTSTGDTLGTIPRKGFVRYVRSLSMAQNRKDLSMGGDIGALEGQPALGVIALVCKAHEELIVRQTTIWPVSCPQCGKMMVLSEA